MFSGVGMASRMLIALSQLAPVISGVQITLMAMVSNSVNKSLACCMTSRELSVSSQDTTGISELFWVFNSANQNRLFSKWLAGLCKSLSAIT